MLATLVARVQLFLSFVGSSVETLGAIPGLTVLMMANSALEWKGESYLERRVLFRKESLI